MTMDSERNKAIDKPEELKEVLGWSYPNDWNIVVYSHRDHAWLEVNSLAPVKVTYWWNLPKTPRKPRNY